MKELSKRELYLGETPKASKARIDASGDALEERIDDDATRRLMRAPTVSGGGSGGKRKMQSKKTAGTKICASCNIELKSCEHRPRRGRPQKPDRMTGRLRADLDSSLYDFLERSQLRLADVVRAVICKSELLERWKVREGVLSGIFYLSYKKRKKDERAHADILSAVANVITDKTPKGRRADTSAFLQFCVAFYIDCIPSVRDDAPQLGLIAHDVRPTNVEAVGEEYPIDVSERLTHQAAQIKVSTNAMNRHLAAITSSLEEALLIGSLTDDQLKMPRFERDDSLQHWAKVKEYRRRVRRGENPRPPASFIKPRPTRRKARLTIAAPTR